MTTGAIPPWAVYVVAVGAGASGVSGVANNASLGRLQDLSREEIRVAEARGKMQAEIVNMQIEIARMMPKEGVLELHRSQQILIDKLIEFTSKLENRFATKNELELAIRKLQGQRL